MEVTTTSMLLRQACSRPKRAPRPKKLPRNHTFGARKAYETLRLAMNDAQISL